MQPTVSPEFQTRVMQPFAFMKQEFRCRKYDENRFELDFSMEPKGFVPSHLHPHMDELFVITGGQGEFVVDGKKITAKVGDQILVKKGIPHSLKTVSHEPLTCVVTYTPCSDTHKMFAIFAGLTQDGHSGNSLMMKGEYLCRKAGLETFAQSPGALGVVEAAVMGVMTFIGNLSGWAKLKDRYLS